MPASRPFQQGLLCDLQLAGAASFTLEGFGEFFDDRWRDLGGDDAAPHERLTDRVQDLIAVRVLEHVARRAGDQHVAHRPLILGARQGHDADRGMGRLESSGGLDAVHRWHANVHQDDVGRGHLHQVERLVSARRLTHDRHLVGVEQRDQRIAEPLVVVHQQHSDLRQ